MTAESNSWVHEQLNAQLAAANLMGLRPEESAVFEQYLSLLLRWNSRINLTAVRDPEQIVSRHFVESIACARSLPEGIATLLDFGSGAGLPGIPIAICRPDLQVTLAEAQNKKAAFLQEAARTLGLKLRVHGGRAENLRADFDCITLRAVDRMEDVVRSAAGLIPVTGWLVAMTTATDVAKVQGATGLGFEWRNAVYVPGSKERVIAVAHRTH
ncbi:MAG TPA: 16S rRNA (guanine(527)-N(7))-methyltransferase RsmG [Terracidiphilus sp.]|jgi:16S rRNA (guanine527-N7)-methyltransferase